MASDSPIMPPPIMMTSQVLTIAIVKEVKVKQSG
jgi:hypothetical protein